MGRNYKQTIDYFPVETHLANDSKMIELISVHGPSAFGVYILLTSFMLADNTYFINDFWDRKKIISYSRRVNMPKKKFLILIDDFIDAGYFDKYSAKNNNMLFSYQIKEKFEKINEKRKISLNFYNENKDVAKKKSPKTKQNDSTIINMVDDFKKTRSTKEERFIIDSLKKMDFPNSLIRDIM